MVTTKPTTSYGPSAFKRRRALPRRPSFGSRADAARWVRDALRVQILEGVFGIGGAAGQMPAEAELSRQYEVSRNAVREALDLLRAEGLVDRKPGVGTFVVGAKLRQRLDYLEGLAESVGGQMVEVHNSVLAWGEVKPPVFVAQRLGLEERDRVLFVERLRHAADVPLSLDTSYLRLEVAPALVQDNLTGHDVFSLVERYVGSSLGWADLTMEAVTADTGTATLLQVKPGSPLLLVQRLTHLEDGTPFDLESIRYRGDRFKLEAVLPRTEGVGCRAASGRGN
ncbi:MAG: GntR family transcriptional regulator [Actinomycetota bacterium]|nr:GntR family transcriptional regulator [Actinomycetota bacterium]